jgi:hypothetical protein
MSLREWSVWRIVAVWLGWPLLATALGFIALLVALWRAAPPLPAGATALPNQGADFAVAFSWPPGLIIAVAALAPPAILTAVWLWQRGRHGAGPA